MTKPTRKVSAQRLDGAFDFALTATAEAVASEAFKTIPVLPAQGAIGRDGRGPFFYDIEEVKANVRANGADIPVFLDHEPGVARGWIDHTAEPIAMPDGSWEWPVEYTAEGLALIASKAYRYNSPTWLFLQDPAITDRQAGRIVGVLEVSLTNLPNQYLRSLNSAEAGGYTVEINLTKEEMDKQALEALGLAEDAAPEAVLAAINSLKAAADKAAAIAAAVGAEADADATAVVEAAANSRVATGTLVTKQAYDEAITARDAAVASLQAAEQALTALKTEQAAQADAMVVAAVDAAIVAGKYTPAAREAVLKQARSDFETFKQVTAALPAHPVAANSVATRSVTTEDTHGLSAEQLAICKQHGIDPVIFAKNLRKN